MLLCVLISTVSFAQNKKEKDTTTQKTVKLNEVIIVGNVKTDPTHSKVSNKYEENVVQPKNVADLFKNITGFSTIKRGNYAIDPSFRASNYEQLNVQYDGGTKAMHACPNRMDPITTHIIPEEIAKIEIIKGPYTVRYGTTFGGVINIVTKKPGVDDYGFHGNASVGYEDNGSSFSNMVALKYATKTYDLTANAGYKDFGSYEDGSDKEIPSSFRSTDYGIKFGYNFSERERIQAHWRQSFGRDVLHAALPMDTDYDNSSILSLDYKKEFENSKLKSLSTKVYYSYVDHLMTNANRPNFMMVEAASAVEATTIGGKLELKVVPNENWQFYSGLDATYIGRDGNRERLVKMMNGMPMPMPMSFTDKVWQDSNIADLGVFTEAKWFASNSTIFNFGLRYNMVISNIKDPADNFETMYDLGRRTEGNISGTVSVKKVISPDFTLEAAYGRGVRSANMIERFINHFTVGQDPYEYVGNPNLKAEVNNQFEVGFKGKKDLTNSFNKFAYSASFYYAFYENYIVGVVDESLNRLYMPMQEPRHPKVFRNMDKAYKTGFEAEMKIDFLDNFYFKTDISYVYAKNKDLNESLPLTPPLTTKLGLGFEKKTYWANATFNLVSKQDNIAETFGETYTKGYETLDIRLGLKPTKNITIGLAATNVFDQTYNDHLSFSFTNQTGFNRVPINEPGRNLTAFLQYKF
ncbi:TonB-dependent receptor [Pontimicrobium aquaticum]|uniref:TonB-dependent receptor n=2 Tax=Pontimicrobium aquaticum TaxID=2565367 RepID=A0A4U0EW16_9FLAO|nr:TonB-dependent receptor [Pontimicrobium aquaticum]